MNPFDPRLLMLPQVPTHYGENGMPQPPHQVHRPPPPSGFGPQEREIREALILQGIMPRKSSGTRTVATPSNDGQMASIRYDVAKSIIAYAVAENPDLSNTPGVTNNPLGIAPAGGPPLVGGAIMVAELRFGHDGTNNTVLFDLPPGAVIKTPIAGSSGDLIARLAPKYFTPVTVGLQRFYRIMPGGPIINNQQFNLLPPRILASNGFVGDPAGVNQAPASGYFAEGSLTNSDQFSKPTRRFYGTVQSTDPAGPANAQSTVVPVSWCAVAVQVTGGISPTPPTGGTAAFPLQFTQLGPAGSSRVGPFPMNTIVPLIDNCQSLEIYNSTPVAAGSEIPFEVIYYLSF